MADDGPVVPACGACRSAGANGADDPSSRKKHPCSDCSFCQWCGDDRCNLCLGKRGRGRKLSIREQIELYDVINGSTPSDGKD